MSVERIALIGYGEVGQTLAADLHARGERDVRAWDRQFFDSRSEPARALATGRHARGTRGLAEAVEGRTLVVSAVTAGQCLAVAEAAAPLLEPGAVFFDLNSVAPATKQEAARSIEAAGAYYVEAAVMSPIVPKRSAAPILLGGPHASDFAARARALGFAGVESYSDVLGRASAAKLCGSVMVKGLEALLTESLVSARRYGVEQTVLTSLDDLLPGTDWRTLAQYMIARSVLHGARRAEEMYEAVRAVDQAGLQPWMSTACAQRQAWAAGCVEAHGQLELETLLDSILEATVRSAPTSAHASTSAPAPDAAGSPVAAASRSPREAA